MHNLIRLLNGGDDFLGLANSDAILAIFVADNEDNSEAQLLPSLNNFRHPSHLDHPIFEPVADLLLLRLQLSPKLNALKTNVAFSDATVPNILEGFPDVVVTGENEITSRLLPLFREIKELGFSNREMRREISLELRILGMEIRELTWCLRLIESLKCRESIGEGYRVICYGVGDVARKVEFLVERMKCSVECLAKVPKYLGVSFEKQIVAKYSVVECLRRKGAIGFEFGLKDLVMPSRLS
ncbi:uncharacterized protein HKW66_Vig0231660 [Vigna angularis]|uniref:Uncharacterized protein n=1 Tax=Phaseolus angularis TaxID=3914 RepID=A0A8T0KAR3_PHAAN|nr:uncharacterized protein HKW66_Vig0231660 [Vigna angularis]